MDEDLTRLLRRMVRAAEEQTIFLAAVFARYRAIERIDDTELARRLDVAVDRLDELALARRPRPNLFGQDVAAIATRFGAGAGALAAIVRQVDAFDALGEVFPRTLLAAARDADDDTAPPEDES